MKQSSVKRDDMRQQAVDLAKICAESIRGQMGHLKVGQIQVVSPSSKTPVTIRKTGDKQLTLLAQAGGFIGMIRAETIARLQGYRVKVVSVWPKEEVARFAISGSTVVDLKMRSRSK